jgi:hypothetical protein
MSAASIQDRLVTLGGYRDIFEAVDEQGIAARW